MSLESVLNVGLVASKNLGSKVRSPSIGPVGARENTTSTEPSGFRSRE